MSLDQASGFYQLGIDQVFQAVEECGFLPTGEYFQLNSYENRVFDLFLEKGSWEQDHIIVKVYRPGRWSEEAILEEHSFLNELKAEGIPAVAPLNIDGDKSTFIHEGMIYSVFPKAMGRMPQELSLKDFASVGQQLAKLHNIGSQEVALHRPSLNVERFGWEALDIVEPWVAPEVWTRYEDAACDVLEYLEDHLDENSFIRIHGDCHKGNILQTDPKNGEKELFFVDFDDFVNGPPVQDFWMMFSGDDEESQGELDAFLRGYESLRHFDHSQLNLIPALRGMRIIYYASWIAKRWSDPSFPKIFPDYRNYIYWAEEVEALEKISWKLKTR